MGPHEAVVANIEEYDNSSQEDSIGHDAQDAAFLRPEAGVFKLNNPQDSRLGWLSVILIIANRMIDMYPQLRIHVSTGTGQSPPISNVANCMRNLFDTH